MEYRPAERGTVIFANLTILFGDILNVFHCREGPEPHIHLLPAVCPPCWRKIGAQLESGSPNMQRDRVTDGSLIPARLIIFGCLLQAGL